MNKVHVEQAGLFKLDEMIDFRRNKRRQMIQTQTALTRDILQISEEIRDLEKRAYHQQLRKEN